LFALPFAAARSQPLDMTQGGPIEVTASDGIDWRQAEQTVVARGNARAVRQGVTVTANELIAHYRKKAAAPGAPEAAQASAPQTSPTPSAASSGPSPGATPDAAGGTPTVDDTSGNEVYRLEAIGDVRIKSATDEAVGDHAIYDIDQAVLVLTGRHLRLTTPQQVLTARDDMEYWPQKHIAVGRGDAVVVTSDGRRFAGDILVGYTTDMAANGGANGPTKPGQTATGQTATGAAAANATGAANPPKAQAAAGATPAAATDADPLAASGKLQRVEAFGNVEIRTPTDIARGDRAVYVPDTGIARLVGHVRVTRGENQLNGEEADVNMKTGISTLVATNKGRVQGLVVPKDAQANAPGTARPGSGPTNTPPTNTSPTNTPPTNTPPTNTPPTGTPANTSAASSKPPAGNAPP